MGRAFEVIDRDIRRMRDLERQIEQRNAEALRKAKEDIEAMLSGVCGDDGDDEGGECDGCSGDC